MTLEGSECDGEDGRGLEDKDPLVGNSVPSSAALFISPGFFNGTGGTSVGNMPGVSFKVFVSVRGGGIVG